MKIELNLIKDAIDDFILLDKICAIGPSPGLLALKQTLDGDVETLIDKYNKSKKIKQENQENKKTDTFDNLNFNNMLNDFEKKSLPKTIRNQLEIAQLAYEFVDEFEPYMTDFFNFIEAMSEVEVKKNGDQ